MTLLKTNDVHAQARRRLLSFMETGQESKARDFLIEYKEEYPEQAEAARLDIAQAYGKLL